jgi:hypothetical protein
MVLVSLVLIWQARNTDMFILEHHD